MYVSCSCGKRYSVPESGPMGVCKNCGSRLRRQQSARTQTVLSILGFVAFMTVPIGLGAVFSHAVSEAKRDAEAKALRDMESLTQSETTTKNDFQRDSLGNVINDPLMTYVNGQYVVNDERQEELRRKYGPGGEKYNGPTPAESRYISQLEASRYAREAQKMPFRDIQKNSGESNFSHLRRLYDANGIQRSDKDTLIDSLEIDYISEEMAEGRDPFSRPNPYEGFRN